MFSTCVFASNQCFSRFCLHACIRTMLACMRWLVLRRDRARKFAFGSSLRRECASVLATMEEAQGTDGCTSIECTLTVQDTSIEHAHPRADKVWRLTDTCIIDGDIFTRISKLDRGLAKFVGANLQAGHPLECNSFIEDMMKCRNAAIHKRMLDHHASKGIAGGDRFVKSEIIDEIEKTIDVDMVGFYHGTEWVEGRKLTMVVTADGKQCVMIKVTPSNLEFVRRGIASVMHVPIIFKKRARPHDIPLFDHYPRARLHKRGFVYCRYRNSDGRIRQKSFPVDRSDINEVLAMRQVEAAAKAQAFWEDNHTPVQGDTPESDGDDAVDEDEGMDAAR